MFRFASARLGDDSQLARDVVQQALVVAIGHASPPESVEAQRAWLRGVVRNIVRHEMRSRRRGREAIERRARATGEARADAVGVDGERAARVRALYLAVTELGVADQELFYAFYRAGRSHASIAEDLGITEKAVEARLYRLRGRLRDLGPTAGSEQ